jgi:hypothetical protein
VTLINLPYVRRSRKSAFTLSAPPQTPQTWKPKIALPAHSSIHPYECLVEVRVVFVHLGYHKYKLSNSYKESKWHVTESNRRAITKISSFGISVNNHEKVPTKFGGGNRPRRGTVATAVARAVAAPPRACPIPCGSRISSFGSFSVTVTVTSAFQQRPLKGSFSTGVFSQRLWGQAP